MPSPAKFLIVDDNSDSRFLLVKTLLRKFPQATILETQDGGAAFQSATSEPLDAIVMHRTTEVDGLTLLRQIREKNRAVPIVLVSGVDRTQAALASGANAFLHYDAWLRIGSVVSEVLAQSPSAGPSKDDSP